VKIKPRAELPAATETAVQPVVVTPPPAPVEPEAPGLADLLAKSKKKKDAAPVVEEAPAPVEPVVTAPAAPASEEGEITGLDQLLGNLKKRKK
jgi:hypothetical protein